MEKTSSQKSNLAKRLAKYSSMAAAFVAATPATVDAQCTAVGTTMLASGGFQSVPIDFDQDGNIDVAIRQFTGTAPYTYQTLFPDVYIYNGGIVMNTTSTGFFGNYFAAGLTYGQQIGNTLTAGNVTWVPGAATAGTGYLSLASVYAPFSYYGPFLGANPLYVGVYFTSGAGNTHYGWVELVVSPDATSVEVVQYGFNPIPADPIPAGFCPPVIPTVSEWGLITLALMLLTFGTVVVGRRKQKLEDGTEVDLGVSYALQNPPFNKAIFGKAAMLTLGLVGLMAGVTYALYGTIALVDIVGTAIAAPIFAYLTHLWMTQNEE